TTARASRRSSTSGRRDSPASEAWGAPARRNEPAISSGEPSAILDTLRNRIVGLPGSIRRDAKGDHVQGEDHRDRDGGAAVRGGQPPAGALLQHVRLVDQAA